MIWMFRKMKRTDEFYNLKCSKKLSYRRLIKIDWKTVNCRISKKFCFISESFSFTLFWFQWSKISVSIIPRIKSTVVFGKKQFSSGFLDGCQTLIEEKKCCYNWSSDLVKAIQVFTWLFEKNCYQLSKTILKVKLKLRNLVMTALWRIPSRKLPLLTYHTWTQRS